MQFDFRLDKWGEYILPYSYETKNRLRLSELCVSSEPLGREMSEL